mgnify:CR=1 FL=1
MVEFSLWDIVSNLLLAARWTLVLSLIAFVGGGLVGLALLVLRTTHSHSLQKAVALYVQLFQGTPLLMQLFLAYFGMAMLGVETSAWTAAAVYVQLAKKDSLAEAKPIVQMLLNPWYPSLVGTIVSLPLLYGAVSGFDFVGGINTVVLCLSLNLYLRWSSFFKTLEPAWMRKYRRWPLR